MMAAEQWYEYQDNYKRYGFDMKPRTERKQNIKHKVTSSTISLKGRLRIILLTLVVGMISVGLMLSMAYAANIKFNINTMTKENAVIQGEIENLTVNIKSGTNIQIVEARAVSELGMVYPTSDQLIYVEGDKNKIKDFASVLKEQAYN